MYVESESISIGQQTRPLCNAGETSANYDPWAFTFADASDFADDPVGFQVASKCASTESEANVGTTTHKDDSVSFPIFAAKASLRMPNIGMTLTYSG